MPLLLHALRQHAGLLGALCLRGAAGPPVDAARAQWEYVFGEQLPALGRPQCADVEVRPVERRHAGARARNKGGAGGRRVRTRGPLPQARPGTGRASRVAWGPPAGTGPSTFAVHVRSARPAPSPHRQIGPSLTYAPVACPFVLSAAVRRQHRPVQQLSALQRLQGCVVFRNRWHRRGARERAALGRGASPPAGRTARGRGRHGQRLVARAAFDGTSCARFGSCFDPGAPTRRQTGGLPVAGLLCAGVHACP